MKVIINGKEEQVSDNLTVKQLLEHFQLPPEITIVEKNKTIISQAGYAAEPVLENDKFELIRYMGGG